MPLKGSRGRGVKGSSAKRTSVFFLLEPSNPGPLEPYSSCPILQSGTYSTPHTSLRSTPCRGPPAPSGCTPFCTGRTPAESFYCTTRQAGFKESWGKSNGIAPRVADRAHRVRPRMNTPFVPNPAPAAEETLRRGQRTALRRGGSLPAPGDGRPTVKYLYP